MLYGTAIETSEVSFAKIQNIADTRAESGTSCCTAAWSHAVHVRRRCGGAADFYKQVFGATELMREFDPDGTTVNHAQLKIGDTMIMLSDPTSQDVRESGSKGSYRTPHSYGGSACICMFMLRMWTEVFKRAVEAGAKFSTRSRTRSGATDAENRGSVRSCLVGCDAAQRADAK